MTKTNFDSPRRFQIWEYRGGHSQLLLRSTKETGFATRIDVLFKNVSVMNLCSTLDGISISEATEEEMASISVPAAQHVQKNQKVYIVRSSDFVGHVIAGVVGWHEDDGKYNDPSHFQLGPL
jgi:hypothetical protein